MFTIFTIFNIILNKTQKTDNIFCNKNMFVLSYT